MRFSWIYLTEFTDSPQFLTIPGTKDLSPKQDIFLTLFPVLVPVATGKYLVSQKSGILPCSQVV